MSVIRFRCGDDAALRTLPASAERALALLNYTPKFRAAVCARIAAIVAGADLAGFVDWSSWPEFTALDPEQLQAAEPLIRRLADAVAARAFEAFICKILLPELVDNVARGDTTPEPPPAA